MCSQLSRAARRVWRPCESAGASAAARTTVSIFGPPKRLRGVNSIDRKAQMLHRWITSPRDLGKWCAYLLILLTPGSFIVLPVVWLVRLAVAPAWRAPASPPGAPSSD